MPKTMLFHRQYLGYSGGHGKVWDYFNHVIKSGLFEPKIFFTSDSVFNEGNPWQYSKNYIFREWNPRATDILFLAGMDWQAIPSELSTSIPVINLIQGVRHADPNLPLYTFLKRPAVRICVSHPIADAILATGQVNGPIYVIPNGLQIPKELEEPADKGENLFIAAMKNVTAGARIAEQAGRLGYTVDLLTQPVSRIDFLRKIKVARLAILLPLPAEGFYLPGLEAMALGTPVIMPDCIGNRQYAIHQKNCLITTLENAISAVRYFDAPDKLLEIQLAGFETARRYSISNEYEKFFEVLNSIKSAI